MVEMVAGYSPVSTIYECVAGEATGNRNSVNEIREYVPGVGTGIASARKTLQWKVFRENGSADSCR